MKVINLLLLLKYSDAFNTERICMKSFDFNFKVKSVPKDRTSYFDFCEEHAANTCCQMNHLDAI